jgi:hypothetical protein
MMTRWKMTKYDDPLLEAAYSLGREKGAFLARGIIDNDTPLSQAKLLIDGYEVSEESIMNVCPAPLSGEWAGEDTPVTIIEEIAGLTETDELLKKISIESAMDAASDVLDVFEAGYHEAFWETALDRAKSLLEASPIE